jgi:hypothetical protein
MEYDKIMQEVMHMDLLLYGGIGIVVITIIIVLVLVLNNKKPKYPPMDITNMVTILTKANVKKIRLVRNKIVVDVQDVTLFDAEALQATGVQGIMIVGDTVKFYIDGDNERTEQLFQQLQQELER